MPEIDAKPPARFIDKTSAARVACQPTVTFAGNRRRQHARPAQQGLLADILGEGEGGKDEKHRDRHEQAARFTNRPHHRFVKLVPVIFSLKHLRPDELLDQIVKPIPHAP